MNSDSPSFLNRFFSLSGKVVVLTGGAGLYGHGLAAQLAAAGSTLILASRNVEALQKVADTERKRGFDVHVRSLDQDQETSVNALRDSVLKDFGRVDGLVNNAVGRPMKKMQDPVASWEASMKTNSTGLFLMSRAFGDVMAAQSHGSIVNIGSIQGMIGPDFTLYEDTAMNAAPDYFFHKGGMQNFTRYLASFYGPKGVRVNCLSPGGYYDGQPEKFVERYKRKTYLRRMADDEDLGPPVIFMLGEGSRYITGANLAVDGGYTAN
jgi:NAD(P)-dependent dehydrogenase (short-subunit alcohol dehydrogenase family)